MGANERKKVVSVVLVLVGLLGVWSFTTGGDLEPSGAPGPTMKTLEEVEPRIAIRASDLPLTITESGSYYLAEDIHFTSTANHAITVECNDVTIDLMGYTLKGPDSGPKCGIYMDGRNNVEIRNGTIKDFGYPAISENSTSGSNHRIIGIRAVSNGSYGITLTGSGHLIKDCTTVANNSGGIRAISGCTLTGNTCCNNTAGIIAGTGSTVTGNTCYGNDHYGIYASSGGCTIIGNTARSNGDNGIYAGVYCLIDQNTAYGNTGGNLSYGTGCVLGTNCAP